MIKLSKRLQAVANMIPNCESVADICSDHAYLPIYLVQNETCQSAIAGDIAQGPCEQGLRQVEKYNLLNKVEVRCGSGLTVLSVNEVSGVAIAGVGGATIIEILEASKEIADSLEFLVLQPQGSYAGLRKYLADKNYCIADENIVFENDIAYQVLLVKKGRMTFNSWLELEYGKINIAKNTQELKKLLTEDYNHYCKVLKQLQHAQSESGRDKVSNIQSVIADLKQLLNDMK